MKIGVTIQFHSEQRSRQKKRKRFPDETEDDIADEQKSDTGFLNTLFYVALDSMNNHLDMRFHTIATICEEFSPTLTFRKMTENQISLSCHKLRSKYSKRSHRWIWKWSATYKDDTWCHFFSDGILSWRAPKCHPRDAATEHLWRGVRCTANLLHNACNSCWRGTCLQ